MIANMEMENRVIRNRLVEKVEKGERNRTNITMADDNWIDKRDTKKSKLTKSLAYQSEITFHHSCEFEDNTIVCPGSNSLVETHKYFFNIWYGNNEFDLFYATYIRCRGVSRNYTVLRPRTRPASPWTGSRILTQSPVPFVSHSVRVIPHSSHTFLRED